MSFDVLGQVFVGEQYGWQQWHELFSRCRSCLRSTIFLVKQHADEVPQAIREDNGIVNFRGSLTNIYDVDRYISLRDTIAIRPPDYLPDELKNAFAEGAACLAIGCCNAAATMFRLCIDLVTKPLLPDPASPDGPNNKQRRDLGLRLRWLFENGRLPTDLRDLAACIHQDGNDGAHVGNLTQADADDLVEFTSLLLERLVTEPKRLEIARERREARRTS
jgi:hypothetical protein